jgi:hypothetical protein
MTDMPHQTTHVIHQFNAPLGTEPAAHDHVGQFACWRVWHVVVIIAVVCFAAGLLL